MLLCVQHNELHFLLCRALVRGYVMGQALGDSAYALSHAWDAQAGYLGEGRCVGNGPSAGIWTLAVQVSTSLPRKSRPIFLSQPRCNSHVVILLCGCLSHLLVKVEKSGFQEAVFTRRTFAFAPASFHGSRSVTCWWTWPPHPPALLTGPRRMPTANRQTLGNFC